MFFIDEAGNEVHSVCTHDFQYEAEMRSEEESWDDLAEEYTAKFAESIKGLYDAEEDVGAVVQYTKKGKIVAYFDYENFMGTVLKTD